jgi:mRNA interferase MazF
MQRGEVRWYRLLQPDKKRPILLLTRNSALEFLSEVTVAPITSTVRDIPSEVALSRVDGLDRDCAVNLDHAQTVPKARIGALIATLTPARMAEVRSALLFALGFNVDRWPQSRLSPMPATPWAELVRTRQLLSLLA